MNKRQRKKKIKQLSHIDLYRCSRRAKGKDRILIEEETIRRAKRTRWLTDKWISINKVLNASGQYYQHKPTLTVHIRKDPNELDSYAAIKFALNKEERK